MGPLDLALAGGLALTCLLLVLAVGRLVRAERRHRRLLEALPQSAVVVFDGRLRIELAAGPALAQLGFDGRRLRGTPIRELIPQARADAMLAHLAAALRGEKRSFEYRSPRSGRDYWVQVVPLPGRGGTVSGGMLVALDVAERRRGEPRLASRTADVEAITDATRALARSVDPDTARRVVCEGAAEVTGAPVAALFEPAREGGELVAKAAVGARLEQLAIPLDDDSGAALAFVRAEEVFVGLGSEVSGADAEFLRRAGAGAVLWHPVVRERAAIGVLAIAWRERTAGVSLRLSAMVGLLGAEAAVAIGRADLLDELEQMARTDSLTGLPNRRYWEQQLPRELARAAREGRPVCVAMLDLDHFKDYNDRRGHQAGDQLLRRSATAWRDALRPYDVLARYGGEEFAVILPGCAVDAARTLVERLRARTPEGESCSAGIAAWDGEESAEQLVGRADGALYEAKRAGRDRAIVA